MKRAKLFLLFSFTAPYAASKKQQSLRLFLGVAYSKLHLPEIIYGILCRFPETANFPRLFLGVAQADIIKNW